MMRRLTAGVMMLSMAMAAGCARMRVGSADTNRESDDVMRQAIQKIDRPAYILNDAEGARLWKQIRAFYAARQDMPAWIENKAPRRQMDELIQAVRNVESEGLDPELYGASMLAERRKESSQGFLSRKKFDPQQAAAMDVWLSSLYLKLASDLADGVSDLTHADPAWKIETARKSFDAVAQLDTALRDNRVAESLAALTPTDPEYRALRKALADYRGIAAHGGWAAVPADLKVKPGQVSEHVGAIARRLAASGDYTGAVPAADGPATYGADLQEAVKRFQRRHGLTDDAVVGPAVAAEMNVPVEARIRQIALNMERWRWLPRDLGDRHILVNIPEMRLDVRDHGSVPLTMRVVVGKQDTPTPIFNDEMTYIVFAPYWNVPSDIAKKETLPSAMKDPDFLQRTNMEIIDRQGNPVDPASVDLASPASYRFRQRPGTSNSLGLVKFMFPNQFNVYLHDTPADSLFARASRSFSHGCVRLEQPEKLAEYVLRDQPDWTPERIAEAMHGQSERAVKLKTALPVYLGYWTARVSADGLLQFRRDVYGIDGRQTAKLTDRLDRLRKSANAAAMALNVHRPTLVAAAQ